MREAFPGAAQAPIRRENQNNMQDYIPHSLESKVKRPRFSFSVVINIVESAVEGACV
jgi:hypothetical protein